MMIRNINKVMGGFVGFLHEFRSTYMRKGVQDDKKVLGRWTIENCNKKINNKIDLSNEDHCGPCGQYILNKSINNQSQIKK